MRHEEARRSLSSLLVLLGRGGAITQWVESDVNSQRSYFRLWLMSLTIASFHSNTYLAWTKSMSKLSVLGLQSTKFAIAAAQGCQVQRFQPSFCLPRDGPYSLKRSATPGLPSRGGAFSAVTKGYSNPCQARVRSVFLLGQMLLFSRAALCLHVYRSGWLTLLRVRASHCLYPEMDDLHVQSLLMSVHEACFVAAVMTSCAS